MLHSSHSIMMLLVLIASSAATTSATTLTYGYDPSPTYSNPLRGFMAYNNIENPVTTSFPYSLEYAYVKMSDLNPAYQTYNWTYIDTLLQSTAALGHHAVIRPYIDYPSLPSALPSYLLQGSGAVTLTSYTDYGGGQSPDYDNARLVSAIVALIAALGQRYDSDVRIAAVEFGFLGFYGEWHDFGEGANGASNAKFASRATQVTVLNAAVAAFPTTQILISQDEYNQWTYPNTGGVNYTRIGRFDDNYSVATFVTADLTAAYGTSSDTYNHIAEHQQQSSYQLNMQGGEVQPAIQASAFKQPPPSGVQPFAPAVRAIHTSWLLDDLLFEPQSLDPTAATAKQMSLLLGYSFTVSQVQLAVPTNSTQLQLVVTVVNHGFAPWYYDLSLYATYSDYMQATQFSQSPNSYGSNSSAVINANLSLPTSFPATLNLYLNSTRVLSNNPLKFANTNIDSSGRVKVQLTADNSNSKLYADGQVIGNSTDNMGSGNGGGNGNGTATPKLQNAAAKMHPSVWAAGLLLAGLYAGHI